MPAAAKLILEAQLRLSRAPDAELAGAALQAQADLDLAGADFIVIAVTPDTITAERLADLERIAAG